MYFLSRGNAIERKKFGDTGEQNLNWSYSDSVY